MMNRFRYIISIILISIYLIADVYSHSIALNYSYTIVGAGLLLIGIPHGAVDHLLIKSDKKFLIQFILKYLIIVFSYFALWYILPILALSIFIGYSAFHFGESELEEQGEEIFSLKKYRQSFFLGLSIISFIIGTHFTESIDLLSNIEGLQFIYYYKHKFNFYVYLIPSTSLIFIVFQYKICKHSSLKTVLLLLLLGTIVPLLLAFALYFICQHSLNAWNHLLLRLGLNSAKLYMKTLPYTIGALIIFLFILLFESNISNLQILSSNFFIFLACISLPHFLLMHLFYQKFKTK